MGDVYDMIDLQKKILSGEDELRTSTLDYRDSKSFTTKGYYSGEPQQIRQRTVFLTYELLNHSQY